MSDPSMTDQTGAASPPAKGDAGQDVERNKQLARDPDDEQARLDDALDESMDGSDPIALTEPGVGGPG